MPHQKEPPLIQFHVVQSSSEDANHPAQNLELRRQEGWCSRQFADPPHEVIFQFPGLCRIKKLKILSHSYKIAKKIELYIGNLPNSVREIARNEKKEDLLRLISFTRATFKRIGYMSLEDNSKTQWKAWELKTANLDVTCSFIKFKMREHHVNEKNIYNQVALIGVEFFGMVKEKFPEVILPPVVQNKMAPALSEMRPSAKSDSKEDDLPTEEFDAETQDQLVKLEHYKENARREENFKKAHELKSQISGLKRTAHQLMILDKEKNHAADVEDFLRAEELKQKIVELRRIKDQYTQVVSQEEQLEEQTRHRRVNRHHAAKSQPPQDETPVVTRRKVARQISIDESGDESNFHPTPQQSYDSQRSRGMRRSYASNNEDEEEEIPFHQPTRRQIDSVQLSGSAPGPMSPGGMRMSRLHDEFNEEEYEEFHTRRLPMGVATNQEDLVPEGHVVHHPDSHHEHASGARLGQHRYSVEGKVHDEQPIRPSKDNRYAFEHHLDAYDQPPPGMEQNVPQVQEIGGPTQEEIVANLESWEANIVGVILSKSEVPPEQLISGVDDLQSYINVFGEYVAKSLHSKLRVHREYALRGIIDYFDQIPADKQLLLTIVCQYMKRALKDTIPQVYFLGIELLQKTIRSCCSDVRKAVVHHAVAPVVPILISMLGETNSRKKNDSEQTIVLMADEKNIEPSLFIKYLTKDGKDKNWRPLYGRLQMLGEFIRKYGFTEQSGLTDQSVMKYIQKHYDHSRREVRTAAVVATMEVYLVLKDTIQQDDPVNWFIQKYLPKDMRDALRKEIVEKLMTEDPQLMRESNIIHPPAPKRRNTLAEHSNVQNEEELNDQETTGDRSRRDNLKNISESQDENIDAPEEDDEEGQAIIVENDDGTLMCNLCGSVIQTDPTEGGADDLVEQHIVWECPILQKCSLCNAVVEVFDMNHHQLTNCDAKNQVKQCPRCKMAIRKEEYKEHVESQACPKAGPNTNICPLCSEEIEPGQPGWKKHMIDEGCAANPKGGILA
eukprot:CAMPEP_0117456192 /NCGR_PEP_ID=MMETSP0759-20121206/11751_1 /TAXON_ID=63605 /ORGANISM="Percolomonas cosmopolitus, Strain WS" /LENGTH=1008 /DNA_ID=CAMNT_0005249525 /DNA_START=127 /DNA_END=3153 /DNA_ORIENTATION=+